MRKTTFKFTLLIAIFCLAFSCENEDNDSIQSNNVIYGLHWKNSIFKLATIDFKGDSIRYSPIIAGLNTFTGSGVFDAINNQYIIIGVSEQGNSLDLNIKFINPVTGIIERSIKVDESFSGLDIANNKIYGIHWKDSNFQIATIDYFSGDIQYSPIIEGLNSFTGSGVFDAINNQYIIIGVSEQGNSLDLNIKFINPVTGIIERSIKVDESFSGLDIANNKIYGIHWKDSNFQIATIDYFSGDILYSPIIEGLNSFTGSGVFDPINNQYIIIGVSEQGNSLDLNIKFINPATGIIERSIKVEESFNGLAISKN